MKKAINNEAVLKTLEDTSRDFQIEVPGENGARQLKPATAGDLIRWVLFNLPMNALTLKDTEHARTFISQSKEATITVAAEDYDWLVKKVEEFGPKILGLNVQLLLDALRKRGDGGQVEDVIEEPG